MDATLKEQLQELLATLLRNAQDAAAWAKGEIPALVREKVALGRVEESFYMGACLLITLTVLIVSIRFFRRCQVWAAAAASEDTDETWLVYAFGQLVLLLIGIVPPLAQVHSFLLVWIAPRLYIVEWLQGMVKP